MWWFLQSYASRAAYLCEIRRRDGAGRAVPMPLAAAVEVLGSWAGAFVLGGATFVVGYNILVTTEFGAALMETPGAVCLRCVNSSLTKWHTLLGLLLLLLLLEVFFVTSASFAPSNI